MRPASPGLAWLAVVPWVLAACVAPGSPPSPPPSASGSAEGVDAPLPSPLPEIVARIDGEPIYLRQITPLAATKLKRAKDPEKEKAALLRAALGEYLDRELLLREAMAQGVQADTRRVQQLYDTARADYPDEAQWKQSLLERGLDPQSFKVELRVQQTVALFVARESHTETAVRALLERLRARSRIETYL